MRRRSYQYGRPVHSQQEIRDFRIKLNNVFKAVRKQGFVARQNFSCCGGCASYELGQYLKEHPDNRGAIYYHRQDAERINDTLQVYIGFVVAQPDGVSDEQQDAEAVALGQLIVDSARAAGLFVEWDGTSGHRPCLSYEGKKQEIRITIELESGMVVHVEERTLDEQELATRLAELRAQHPESTYTITVETILTFEA